MIALVVGFAAAGCSPQASGARHDESSASSTPEPTALPDVAAAPREDKPAWIDEISPAGEAADGAQIRVRFKHDLVPIEALESSDRANLLTHFVIEPQLPGRFIILTPKMVGFQADAPIPHASRIVVKLTAGLADRAGDTLASDYSWSFTTQALTLSGPDDLAHDTVSTLSPTLTIGANAPLDTSSLVAHTHLVERDHRSHVVDVVVAPTPTPDPSAEPTDTPDSNDASGSAAGPASYSYDLVPAQTLAKATIYDVVVSAGAAPLYGNLPLENEFAGTIRTYGPLMMYAASQDGSASSRFAGGTPQVGFSNDIDPESIAKAITLTPAPAPGLELAQPGTRSIRFNTLALKPETTYTVHVAGTLTDAYGQRLGKDGTTSFSTGALSPDIWAPSGLSVFPAPQKLALRVATTNLPQNAFHSAFRTLQPRDLIANDVSGDAGPTALLPDKSTWGATALPHTPDVEHSTTIAFASHLEGKATGFFSYGISSRTAPTVDDHGKKGWVEPVFYGTIGLTNVGLFAQWFPSGGIVRVAHLADGSPIARATIDVYESYAGDDETQSASADEAPCASGTADASGTWTLTTQMFAACASTAKQSARAPSLLVVAHDGADWAYARTTGYGDGYAYGLENTGWSAGAPNALGAIVSDRTLYQPGEDAKFLAVAYFEKNGVIARGTSARYTVEIDSPSGTKIALGSFAPDAFGAFTIPLTVATSAEVGYWTIVATGSDGETINGTYRVAEFKPPNFKVDLTLDRDFADIGTNVASRSVSTYLFGAPVEGGTSHITVTRARAYLAPKGWDAYAFGREWLYPEREPSLSSDVLQKDVPIDANGNASIDVPVGTDLPFAATYTVTAQTTDVSHLAVADTKAFTALPSDALIGLRTNFVATAGQPIGVDAIVTDPSGKPVAGRHVHLILQRRIYKSATQIDEGSETPADSVTYQDVAAADVPPEDAAPHISLTAPTPGEYRLRANFSDASSDLTATDVALWVAGPGENAWYQNLDRGITVKLDKATYRPGDTATALIESPYPDADLSFAVLRHGVLYALHRSVHGSGPQVRFTITPDMLPNAAVEAFLVRRGPSVASRVPKGLKNLASLGFASFDVALDAKYLALGITPRAAKLEPAATQTLALHLKGRDGKPVAGEVALAVVNDAILQLSGYRFPDLVKMVYADQPISTRFGDSRQDVKLAQEPEPVEKGFGFGGGAMAGPAGTRVRTKFVPLAYWNGAVHTDAAGNAQVSFTLPDDLTTWRVLAVGLSSDARFGNADTTFITTKPLVTNPVLPQFARPGDRFAAGVSVTNVARATGTLDIAAAANGGATFASGAPNAAATTAAAAGATQAYRFPVTIASTHDARFTFTTKLGAQSDAFTFAVPVLSDDVLEHAITTGATATSASVPLDVAEDLTGSLGGLDVTAASTLLGEVTAPQAALAEPAYPFGTLLASRIAVASDAIVLDRTYGHTADVAALQAVVAADLAALRRLTLPDGGFADWPSQKSSDVYTTAFDVQQLIQAKAAGFDVTADIAHAHTYLSKVLADPFAHASCDHDRQCAAEARLEVLETFGALGDDRDDFLSDIMTYQPKFEYYERVELARFLLRLPDWKTRGLALRDELFQQVNLSARHATVDVRGSFDESEVAGQSQMLGLAIAGATPQDDVDRLLQSLLDLRHNGRWGCFCDDAEAMNALVLYAAQNASPPNFIATLALPATPPKIAKLAFSGYTKTIQNAKLPMNEVTRGPSTVTLEKSGSGTLHYVVDLSYQVPESSPGIYQGIRIDRVVRAAGTKTTLASFGLAKPGAPTSVPAGTVYDVEDRVVVDHPVENVLVVDPLPAGFEAVDQTFNTSSPADLEGTDTWAVDYQEIYKNRVVTFTSHLDPGAYAMHYLVRSVTPGTYAWPGATAQLQFAPEEFGRTAASQLVVSEP